MKSVTQKYFDRLANRLAQFGVDQLGRLFAEAMRQKVAAASAASVADGMLSVKEAADAAGVADETIRRWCAAHGLGRQFGPTWIVSGALLKAFIESGHVALTTASMPDEPHDIQKNARKFRNDFKRLIRANSMTADRSHPFFGLRNRTTVPAQRNETETEPQSPADQAATDMAKQIVAAAAKARGETREKLTGVAAQIVAAAAKARGESQ